MLDHALPSLIRLAVAEEFVWDGLGTTELTDPAAEMAWQMACALRSLHIRLRTLDAIGVALGDLLVDALALASLDVYLMTDVAGFGFSAEDTERIVAELADAEAELASETPARIGALQRLAVWHLNEPSASVLAALPRSVECAELHVARVDECAFDDPDNDAWTALSEAFRRLAPASQLRRLVMDAPAAMHRPGFGDWLRARSGRDVEVAWMDSTRASAIASSAADLPAAQRAAPAPKVDHSAGFMRKWLLAASPADVDACM